MHKIYSVNEGKQYAQNYLQDYKERIKKIDGGLDLEEDYKKFLEKELSRKQSNKPLTEYEYVLDAERRVLSRTSRQNF